MGLNDSARRRREGGPFWLHDIVGGSMPDYDKMNRRSDRHTPAYSGTGLPPAG